MNEPAHEELGNPSMVGHSPAIRLDRPEGVPCLWQEAKGHPPLHNKEPSGGGRRRALGIRIVSEFANVMPKREAQGAASLRTAGPMESQ